LENNNHIFSSNPTLSERGTVIIIAGATASGKTALALQLARFFSTEIISADSRQCYKELNIGVAKPTQDEFSSVPHYFINSHSVYEEVNAGTFEQYALQSVEKIFRENPVAVMVGGTGLFIKTFCEGMDKIPQIPLAIRNEIIDQYEKKGLEWLQNEVRTRDNTFWQIAEQQNPQRLMRALEVLNYTEKSIASFRGDKKMQRPFNIIKIGLELPREELYRRINLRVDKMMESGLEQEARRLIPLQHLNALKTVGYSELFDYFSDKISLTKAVENIKTNTRHYAKRQMTWFKKDKEITWFAPDEYEKILTWINNKISLENKQLVKTG
jgi:tRNA dimethylallyltransferase